MKGQTANKAFKPCTGSFSIKNNTFKWTSTTMMFMILKFSDHVINEVQVCLCK